MIGYIVVRYAVIYPVVGRGPLADVLTILPPVAITAVMAPFGAYRTIDALVWVLPVVGVLLLIRLAWRIAFLPHRDWPIRISGLHAPGDGARVNTENATLRQLPEQRAAPGELRRGPWPGGWTTSPASPDVG